MERLKLLAMYDKELRIDLQIPGMRKDIFPNLIRFIRPTSGMNYIHYSRLKSDELDTVIEEQIDYLSQIDQPFSWHIFEHDQPPELEAKLTAHGFVRDDDPDKVLILDLRTQSSKEPALKDWLIRKLDDPGEVGDVAKVEQAIYGGDFDWLIGRFSTQLEVPGYLSIYAAYIEEKPVSVGWIFFNPDSQFASLYGGGTLPQYRGRGIYQSLVNERLREACERGYLYAVTGASEMSYPILIKMGFRYLTSSVDFVWNPESRADW